MKNRFPYYRIHKIVMNNLGWAAENCLGTSEWEDCLTATIERINFMIWNELENMEQSEWDRKKYQDLDEDELWSRFYDIKHPKRTCNICGSEDVVDILNLCEKHLLKDKKFITLFEKKTKRKDG